MQAQKATLQGASIAKMRPSVNGEQAKIARKGIILPHKSKFKQLLAQTTEY